jgi:hypothetical protein
VALPGAFLTALARPGVTVDLWVEIEGVALAFGLTQRAGSWFSGRGAGEQRSELRGSMVTVPGGVDQEAQPLEGTSTVGQFTASIIMDADSRALIAGSGRSDGLVAMRAPAQWAASTAYMIGDIIRPIRTDAAGSTSWFRCTTAGTSGSSEPSWAATGTTSDGGTLVWTRMGPRDLDLTTTDPICFTGDAVAFPSSGVLYVGRETIAYTSKATSPNGGGYFSGISRGRYALPGRTGTQKHTEADLLSPYLRFLATRAAVMFATLDGTDANRVARWAGTIQAAKTGAGATTIDLTMESVNAEFRATLFATQRRGKLLAGLVDGAGAYTVASSGERAAETTRLLLSPDSLAGDWTDGATMFVRVEDEWITGTVSVVDSETALTIASRAVLSSTAAQHGVGTDVKEVYWTGSYDASGPPEARVSHFTQGSHPLEVVLQMLLSREGDGANGTWDVLPPGWGVGLDASRVDIAGILALKRAWFPSATHQWAYQEPFSFSDTIAEILKPHGCYDVPKLGDLSSIRRISVPIPGATVRQLGASEILAPAAWDGQMQNVVGLVEWKCDGDPISDDFRQTYRGVMQGPGVEAQEFYAGRWVKLMVEARGQFTGQDPGAAYFGSSLATRAPEAAQRYFEMVRDRYARPLPVISIECSYSALDIEIGDVVSLTAEHVPDATSGGSGVAAAVCEVLSKQVDDAAGRVSLKLAHIPTPPRFRLVAPSGIVSSWSSGTKTITLTDGEFNDPDQARTDGFRSGQVVAVYSSDLATSRGTATISSVTSTTLVLGTDPAGIVATDVVLLDSYDSQPDGEKSIHAYLADGSNTLGADADPAHWYAP